MAVELIYIYNGICIDLDILTSEYVRKSHSEALAGSSQVLAPSGVAEGDS